VKNKTQKMKIIWHYTTLSHAKRIVADKFLKVSKVEKSLGLKPAIWFSKNHIWEPTATKMVSDEYGQVRELTIEEQREILGMIRFGIEFDKTKLISWRKYQYQSRIASRLYNAMEEAGIAKGAKSEDWYACFSNIRCDKWLKIEQYDGKQWTEVWRNEFIEAIP
jgi:hypothetical protein